MFCILYAVIKLVTMDERNYYSEFQTSIDQWCDLHRLHSFDTVTNSILHSCPQAMWTNANHGFTLLVYICLNMWCKHILQSGLYLFKMIRTSWASWSNGLCRCRQWKSCEFDPSCFLHQRCCRFDFVMVQFGYTKAK